MDLNKLKARLEEARTAAKAIYEKAESEDRQPTEEERSTFDAKMAEVRSLKKDIENLEELQASELRQSVTARTVDSDSDTRTESRVEISDRGCGRLRYFKNTPEGRREAYETGMYLRMVLAGQNPNFRGMAEEAKRWVQEYGQETRAAMESEESRAAMSGQVNQSGAFLAPTGFATEVIDAIAEYGDFVREIMLQNDQWTITGGGMNVPKFSSGVTTYWVGDTSSVTESKPTVDNVELTPRKLAALIRVPTDLFEDSPMALADKLTGLMAKGFGSAIDDAAFNGTGTSSYGQIVGMRTIMIDGNHAKSYVTATSGDDTFAALLAADLAKLVGALPKRARGRAKWWCSNVAWGEVFLRLGQAQSGTTMQEFADGRYYSYAGLPIVIADKMPAGSGTDYSAKIMLACGVMGQAACLGIKRDFTVRQSDQRYLEYDQIGILGTQRLDIKWGDIGDSSNAGSMVGLLGN